MFKIYKQFILDPLSFILACKSKPGFTIIELIVVFSVIAILSTVGIASFSSYTNVQKLQTTALDVKTALTEARSESISQKNTCQSGVFQGYELIMCGGPGHPTCTAGNDYELDVVCSAVVTTVDGTGKKFPTNVSIDSSTTNSTYLFIPITGGVGKGGSIVLDGPNGKQTITVSTTGVIQ